MLINICAWVSVVSPCLPLHEYTWGGVCVCTCVHMSVYTLGSDWEVFPEHVSWGSP